MVPRRYDGAPAPSRHAGVTAGDAKAAAREARENATCDHCGADEDYDDLTRKTKNYVHNCPRLQKPSGEPVTLCVDCAEDHTPEEDHIDSLKESEEVYVRYECGIARKPDEQEPETMEVRRQVGWDEDDEPIYEYEEVPRPDHQNLPDLIPVECECGAGISEVYDG